MRHTAFALLLLLGSVPALAAEQVVTPTQVDDRKAVIATVEPVHELPARARIGGTIAEIKVREGDRVAAGDRLALVVDQKLLLQMRGIEARIQGQQASRDQAKLDFDRAQELRRTGAATQVSLEVARTQLDIAERTLQSTRSEKDVILQQSTEGAVLAPGPGRVLKVPVAVGSVVLPGEDIADIATDNYILRLQLPERHARSMQAGDTILIGARGLEGDNGERLRRGQVTLVYPEITQGRVTADVAVDNLGDYFVGELTRVWISTGKRDAIILPEAYISRRFGVSYVRLKDGTDVVVQPGAKSEAGIEILSGLRQGDVAVTP